MIDLPGMGSSSRSAFDCKNGVQADKYMMKLFEQWRVEMGELTNFYLAGHSYGGYITGTYASLHP